MNIKHKPGGEPEIKLDAAETRALRKAMYVCRTLKAHVSKADADDASNGETFLYHLIAKFGRKED